jgi:ribosomal protein L37AE/L43A
VRKLKLIKIINQHRRDFNGIYKCEGCGDEEKHSGCYDDRNFHDNVTPEWKCSKCGKSTIDLGIKPKLVQTKYSEFTVV